MMNAIPSWYRTQPSRHISTSLVESPWLQGWEKGVGMAQHVFAGVSTLCFAEHDEEMCDRVRQGPFTIYVQRGVVGVLWQRLRGEAWRPSRKANIGKYPAHWTAQATIFKRRSTEGVALGHTTPTDSTRSPNLLPYRFNTMLTIVLHLVSDTIIIQRSRSRIALHPRSRPLALLSPL